MPYVDGFVLPIPIKNLPAYKTMARKMSKIFRELGALEFRECVADDFSTPGMTPFTKSIKTKPGETIVLAYVTYKSRAHRDRVTRKLNTDPRCLAMAAQPMPFDRKRMLFGGFKVIVSA